MSYSPFLLPVMRKVHEGALSVLTLWTVGTPEDISCGVCVLGRVERNLFDFGEIL